MIGTTTALTGLLPYTNYSVQVMIASDWLTLTPIYIVQVLAYTSAGDGDLSPPTACATEPDGE